MAGLMPRPMARMSTPSVVAVSDVDNFDSAAFIVFSRRIAARSAPDVVKSDPHGIGGFPIILQRFAFRGLRGFEANATLSYQSKRSVTDGITIDIPLRGTRAPRLFASRMMKQAPSPAAPRTPHALPRRVAAQR